MTKDQEIEDACVKVFLREQARNNENNDEKPVELHHKRIQKESGKILGRTPHKATLSRVLKRSRRFEKTDPSDDKSPWRLKERMEDKLIWLIKELQQSRGTNRQQYKDNLMRLAEQAHTSEGILLMNLTDRTRNTDTLHQEATSVKSSADLLHEMLLTSDSECREIILEFLAKLLSVGEASQGDNQTLDQEFLYSLSRNLVDPRLIERVASDINQQIILGSAIASCDSKCSPSHRGNWKDIFHIIRPIHSKQNGEVTDQEVEPRKTRHAAALVLHQCPSALEQIEATMKTRKATKGDDRRIDELDQTIMLKGYSRVLRLEDVLAWVTDSHILHALPLVPLAILFVLTSLGIISMDRYLLPLSIGSGLLSELALIRLKHDTETRYAAREWAKQILRWLYYKKPVYLATGLIGITAIFGLAIWLGAIPPLAILLLLALTPLIIPISLATAIYQYKRGYTTTITDQEE